MTDRIGMLSAGLLGVAMMCGGACTHTHATPPPASVPPTKPPFELGVETRIPVASTPQGFLKEGAEKKLQQRLHAKGFLTADQQTGQLDDDTRQALRKFQKSEGLPTTGLPSYETARHLDLELDAIYITTRHPKDPSARPR